MEFSEFRQIFQRETKILLENGHQLYVADVAKDTLWQTYLDSFPLGTNEVFRQRREYDCSCCRHFIKQFGAVVAIVNNETVSIWRLGVDGSKFQPVVNALMALVENAPIKDAFVTSQAAFGTDHNFERLENGQVHTWNHFRIELPDRLVNKSRKSDAALTGELRDNRRVFQRSLEEISRNTVETVLDLIAEDSLYRGEEWKAVLEAFLSLYDEYHALPVENRDNYCWAKSVEVGGAVAKIRNHSIGVLLQDVSSGTDVSEAVRRYEVIIAPQNYKRPKPIFTKQMVEEAQRTVTELGLLDSLGRRHARLDDISVRNVLWSNRDAACYMRGGNAVGVFDALKDEVTINPRQFERLQGTDVNHFIKEILPNVTSLEVLVENRHEGNLASLIASQVVDSPTLFKWDNGFSWAYNGNIADSMKQRVKAAGGNVEGVLRFSLQWNTAFDNPNDYDAHCFEPNGNHIYYPNKMRRHVSSGMLDVDIVHPTQQVAVENITWGDLRKMPHGIYHLFVHCYSHRGGTSGFEAEIEFAGQIFEYVYHRNLNWDENVTVAKVQLDQDSFKILESLPSTASTKTVWNLTTNQFHPVSAVSFSPNYWDDQHGIGNRHYFFYIAGCRNDTNPNGFFNEYLRHDFEPHWRIFEALGAKMRVEWSEDQLSGLGFSTTKRNSLVVKADGKPVKIIF